MAVNNFFGNQFALTDFTITLWILSAYVAIPLALYICMRHGRRTPNKSLQSPPHVTFTHDEFYNNPMNAFKRAIRESDGVFTMCLGDKLAYVVSNEYTEPVFKDKEHFSFKSGVLSFLNVSFLQYIHGGSIMHDMDSLVTRCITRNLEMLVKRVGPIIRARVTDLAAKQGTETFDPMDLMGEAGAAATISIVLGERFSGKGHEEHILTLAHGIADLAGMYKSESVFARIFPTLWRNINWLKIAIFDVGLYFTRTLGISIWKEMSILVRTDLDALDKENITILAYLVRQHVNPTSKKRLSLTSRLWIMLLCIIAIFASVHQTVINTVWTLYELASRPEDQRLVREEMENILFVSHFESTDNDSKMSIDKLLWKKTPRLDSFIREVLRMKGEVLGSMRMTRTEIALGKYTIPKGQYVLPIVALSNRSPELHSTTASEFDGTRWIGSKSAATIDSGYLAFGMGRWACPGRFLAVAEIKLLVLSLLSVAHVEIPVGMEVKYDKMDVAMSPPHGELRLRALKR